MKVCILGVGAIGGLFAARLARAGVEVSALARGATLEAIRRGGITVRGASGEFAQPVRASDDPRELGPQDVVVLAVKTTALAGVPASIGPLLGPGTAVVSAMNGVPWWFFEGLGERWRGTRLAACDPDGRLAQAMPAGRVVGCVVHMASAVAAPGTIDHRFGERLIFGEPGGRDTPRLAAIAGAFRAAGFQAEVTPRIEEAVWLKLWGNMTMNPISALTGTTMDLILGDPLAREFASEAMREAARIGERIGLPIAMSPEERHAITAQLGAFRTSMLQDVDAGRPIELDAIVGAVSEMGRVAGVPTPSIDALFGLARVFARARGLYPPQAGRPAG